MCVAGDAAVPGAVQSTAAAAAVVVLKTGGFHKLAANDSMTKECRYIYSTISTSLYCVLYCLAECLRKT